MRAYIKQDRTEVGQTRLPEPEVITFLSCSNQLNLKFTLLIRLGIKGLLIP